MRKSAPAVIQSVTTAPESLEKEQEARIKRYLLTMLIRTVCFVAAVPLHGWMRWTSVAMAVVLPYIAVVFANAVHPRAVGVVTPVLPTTYAVPSIAPPPRQD
ncbi:MAG: DUF3099 domain-containing protein [Dermatophilaceae bacterium]